jgi:RHS repeat-associated protein
VGERRDDVTGLDNLRLRHLDPAAGRFVSQDPALGDLAVPMSLHRYAYVNNNPVNLVDPSGAETLVELMVAVATNGINAAQNYFSKLSFFCRYVETVELIQEGLKLASLFSFVSFSVTDWLAQSNPLTDADRKVDPWSAGYQFTNFQWTDENARSGELEKVTVKLVRDLTQDVKMAIGVSFKGGGATSLGGSLSATIDPVDKFVSTLQLSVSRGITLKEILFCGVKKVKIGEILLATTQTVFPSGQTAVAVGVKASAAAGLFEVTFNILKGVGPRPASLQIGGYGAGRPRLTLPPPWSSVSLVRLPDAGPRAVAA